MISHHAAVQTPIDILLRHHARYAWDAIALALVDDFPISYPSIAEAQNVGPGLCIPREIPFDPNASPLKVNCFGIEIMMLHPFDPTDFPDFGPVAGQPWLWRNSSGAFMLSFNLAGFIEHFLGFGEERLLKARDGHGRLPLEASTLYKLGVLHEPLLNQYLFAILAFAKGQAVGLEACDPSIHVLPPVLVLSHDCDQLRGNDLISQSIRFYRFFAPLKRLRFPAFSNLRHIVENALFPRKYFFDDALAMLAAERRLGFRSVFYFLNGIGGRFGARSGPQIISEFVQRLPADTELGIHYNYRYVFDRKKLSSQLKELEKLTGRTVRSGRAHYLVFDPNNSFDLLEDVGIQADESMGFSTGNGFRVGFAGAFRVFQFGSGNHNVVEIPLHFMDSNTVPRDDEYDVLLMVAKVEKVGGVITMLYHPGTFNTPETPELKGIYEKYLTYFFKKGYRSLLPMDLVALLKSDRYDDLNS